MRASPIPRGAACRPGGTVLVGSPADFGKLIADETEKWAKVIKFAGDQAGVTRRPDVQPVRSTAADVRFGSWLRKNVSERSKATSDWLASTLKRAGWLFLRLRGRATPEAPRGHSE